MQQKKLTYHMYMYAYVYVHVYVSMYMYVTVLKYVCVSMSVYIRHGLAWGLDMFKELLKEFYMVQPSNTWGLFRCIFNFHHHQIDRAI